MPFFENLRRKLFEKLPPTQEKNSKFKHIIEFIYILVTGLNCMGPDCNTTSPPTQQNCTNGQCTNIIVSDNCKGPNCDVMKNCTGVDCKTQHNCTGHACKQIVNCTKVGYTEIKGDCIKGNVI